ncbi:MAG: hypothetical protein DLM57_06275 [Pseudonocardiales bacterium]|nr:MAG: hypothetical protein DLM57_06275 [Pseudonocardiales bacterium]
MPVDALQVSVTVAGVGEVAETTGALSVPVCAEPLPDPEECQYAAALGAASVAATQRLGRMSSPRRSILLAPFGRDRRQNMGVPAHGDPWGAGAAVTRVVR